MKTWMLLAVVCLGWASATLAGEAAPAKKHPDSKTWDNLFAEDLSDAAYPKGVWSVQEGVLTATEDRCIWTKKQYENFVLDLEFKNDKGTNSGVFVYCSDPENFIPNSVEVQICDDFAEQWRKMPKSWHCGAIFGHAAPAKSAVNKPGEWNRMTITCKGPVITVLLNGQQVNRFDMTKWTSAKKNPDGTEIPAWLSKPKAELAAKGHVGLQGKHAGAPIYFRNLKIKPLD